MPSAAPRTIYQVSELADILRGLLEDSLPRVWVQGEISNLARPASGHWYFTLKDAGAQLRCVMFKGQNFHIRPPPRDGDSVLVRAQVSLYAARGDLQIICEHLEPAGEGALLRAFEALRTRLGAEGLFDPAHKRPIPPVPRRIGLVTSATGAAVQDVLSTLARRFPLAEVFLLPVPVQGAEAAPAIVRALAELPRRAPVDVLLLVRGGGSLEDLWAFNEEAVARAIRACTVPVICGVGHEVDTTIADFAADLRAPTPTAAAEHATPDIQVWRRQLAALGERLVQGLGTGLQRGQRRVDELKGRLGRLHPGRRLQDHSQRLDELAQRLERAGARTVQQRGQDWRALDTRFLLAAQRLPDAGRHRLERAEHLLHSLSPLAVLRRGYAIVARGDGAIVTRPAGLSPGEALDVRVAEGRFGVTVRAPDPARGDD